MHIELIQYYPAWGLPSASPFCTKMETYLKLSQLDYTVTRRGDQRKTPKNKLPLVKIDGELFADSGLIIDHLQRILTKHLDHWLTHEQHAVMLAFRRLIEEHLYWAMVYSRWVDPEGWAQSKVAFFSILPKVLRWIIPSIARRQAVGQLYGQGMGRHAQDEVYQLGAQDVHALSEYMGDKPFFMGDQPASVDASVYAFLQHILKMPYESALKQSITQCDNLVAYCQRIEADYYANGK